MASCIVTQLGRLALSEPGRGQAFCQSQQPTIKSAQRPDHVLSTGCELLNIPEDILYGIAWHFTLDDWAKGPARVCRSLNTTPLPRVILDVSKCAERSAKTSNKLLHGLKWAVPRMALVTCSVEVRTGFHDLPPGLPLESTLLDDISNLRCFMSDAAGAPIKDFEEWVLQRAPHLAALQLPRSEAQIGMLQHLKHLEMTAHAFAQKVLKAAEQLPSLETLYLHHGKKVVERTVDVAGCQHLRRFVVKGRFAPALSVQLGPKCRLEIHVSGGFLKHLLIADPAALQKSRVATLDLVVDAEKADRCLPQDSGMCPRLARFESLTLKWPVNRLKGTDKPDKNHAVETEKFLLRRFMPSNGQRLRSLKRLIIWAEGAISCSIPAGLPNLEELVLSAGGVAEVSFEDPTATITAVKRLYVLGQPLPDMGDGDLRSAKEKAAKRGLLLSTISPQKVRKKYRRSSLCMYLRPVTASELSFEEVYDRVIELARQCRCRACSDCLSRAGFLMYS